jgi:tetratricopeptide (TPR) repeat protein
VNADAWSRVKDVLDECLDLEPAQWPAFLDRACGSDAALRAEVDSLLAAHQAAGDFIAEPVLKESFVGTHLGHWKVVRDIGEGGMGRVCLAERDDGQYQQLAAIKILKRGMETDLTLRHFQMERQILAGMRHANIARLLDGGITPGGRPFFVMEHIEGQPIDEFAATKNLALPERLRLFQQVCDAVFYANQRLVVHRDIKPGNILVTLEGVAKLLDFGIAAIVSPEPAPGTLTPGQMLTPGYASPEQLRGEPVTTSSDVYSLGVLLKKLLGPVSGDLAAIIAKATERDPSRRYSSAEQLSDDIGRYLHGRPVLARVQTWRYRTSKFVGRNKLGVAAASLILILLAGGITATLWQARIAALEHRRAEQRASETRQLANSLLFELHDAIKDLPGSTGARNLIVQRSLKYLDRITAVYADNPALRLESAEGYKRLGDVQGRSGDANLGEFASATGSYRKAVALLRQTASDPALDARRRRLLALTLIRLRSDENVSEAIPLLESLHQKRPQDSGLFADLATGYGAMANLLIERRDLRPALAWRLKEWNIRKQVLGRDTRSATAMSNYALSSKMLASLLWKMKRAPEAMDYYQIALHLEETLAALDPASTAARMAISFSHSDIGFLLSDAGRYPEALQHYGETIKIREDLAAADPNNAQAAQTLVSAYWRCAEVFVNAGDTVNALELLNKAVKTLARSKNAGSAANRTALAEVYAGYGAAYRARKDFAAAQDWNGRAKVVLTSLQTAGQLPADGADLLEALSATPARPRRAPQPAAPPSPRTGKAH